MQVTFRSGAQIEVDATEFTLNVNYLSGELRDLRYVTPPDATRGLKYLAVSEVVAVVAIDDPSEQPEPAETS
jgi:hypothetical protein